MQRDGIKSIVQHKLSCRPVMLSLVLAAPLLAGCSNASDYFSRDAEWFSRPGRVFIKNISIETPPLTPDKPVTPEDLISADGACPGMPQPGAEADAAAARSGTVALNHTECDVARGIGTPDNVSLSTNPRGDRVAVLTYSKGPRAGIYTFTAGRLTSIDRGQEPVAQPKAKSKRRH